jgi:hypothetical protein
VLAAIKGRSIDPDEEPEIVVPVVGGEEREKATDRRDGGFASLAMHPTPKPCHHSPTLLSGSKRGELIGVFPSSRRMPGFPDQLRGGAVEQPLMHASLLTVPEYRTVNSRWEPAGGRRLYSAAKDQSVERRR